jgi:HEAT repeat protein
MVLYCLRDLGVPELARFGRERLRDPDPGVRLAALSAITRGEEREPDLVASAIAVTELIERDPDPGVRRSAAVALGRLGVASPEVLAALRRAEQSDDESLTRAARAALARLPGSN